MYQSASEDEVKAAYKKVPFTHSLKFIVIDLERLFKLAFIHHPDKNPDDPDATARFQAVSQANDTLHKHFSRPQGGPPRGFGRGPFGGGFDEEEDDEFYSDDDDSYGHDSEEDFAFFMFVPFHLLYFLTANPVCQVHVRGGYEKSVRESSRCVPSLCPLRPRVLIFIPAFRRETEERHESPQEYSDRLRKQREEQEAAALRRKHEAQQRKERKAYDREQGACVLTPFFPKLIP